MTRTLPLVAVLFLTAAPAAAQHGYRDLDSGRPLRVSDAYPVEFLEFEWQMGATGSGTDRSGEAIGSLGLEFGFAANWEVSVAIEGLWSRMDGSTTSGVDGFSAHVMFNPNQEGVRTPAFAFQAGIATPGFGRAGRNATAVEIEGLATRTMGAFRVHVNAGHEWLTVEDGGNEWAIAFGADRVLGLSGRLIAADVAVEAPVNGDARVWTEIGMRLQLSQTYVLDFGLGSRMDEWSDGRPHIAVTVGLSHGFGIAALMGGLTYPNPRID